MEWTILLDLVVDAVRLGLLAFIGYGAYLVLGGGGLHRNAPEDAAHLDLTREA
jgi:hypothetical protein